MWQASWHCSAEVHVSDALPHPGHSEGGGKKRDILLKKKKTQHKVLPQNHTSKQQPEPWAAGWWRRGARARGRRAVSHCQKLAWGAEGSQGSSPQTLPALSPPASHREAPRKQPGPPGYNEGRPASTPSPASSPCRGESCAIRVARLINR